MKKTSIACFIFFFLLLGGLFGVPKSASAQACPNGAVCEGGCTAAGMCAGGRICQAQEQSDGRILFAPSSTICGGGEGAAVLGGVRMPQGVIAYNNLSRGDIGIVNFISRLLRMLTVICGIWFMFNMIYAGILFITSSGDTAVFGKFKDSLFYSIIGLFVLAAAYMIAGLIGAIFFGDPGFIIRPTLFQAS